MRTTRKTKTRTSAAEALPRAQGRSSHLPIQKGLFLATIALVAGRSAVARAEAKPEPAPSPPVVAAAPPAATSSGWWIGAVVQGDIGLLPGGDVCGRSSQADASYSCFRADREQYVGVPVPGAPAGVAVSYGTTRIALHAEHAIFGNFTAGGRVGFAFGGGPTPSKGPPFVPLHLEARLAYWIGPKLAPERGFRGFVTLVGGLAQVDASRTIEITECRAGDPSGCAPATNVQPGGPNPGRQTLDAYKKSGQGFVGLGAGIHYSFVRGSGLAFEVKAMQLLPSFGIAVSPSISYVVHVP